ncbi:hypothetical protein ACS0TY_030546 [Phlomoides rotata]
MDKLPGAQVAFIGDGPNKFELHLIYFSLFKVMSVGLNTGQGMRRMPLNWTYCVWTIVEIGTIAIRKEIDVAKRDGMASLCE